MRRDKDRIN